MFQVAAVAIRRQKTKALAVIGLLGVVLGATISAFPAPVIAAVGINKTINFQGKVVNTNGTNVANGSYTFVFKLYSVASGGTANWTESKSLTVTDGVFQTNLGDTTSLPGSIDFNSDNIYMGITFSTDAEMSPRIQFTAAAYAFNSNMLGGITAAGFAQLNPGSAQSGSLNVTGSLQAATSLQAPLVDTASAVALNIGTGTASSVTVGRATAANAVTIQGSNSSTWTVTGASGSTTLAFANPTSPNTITFPNAGGTVCTTTATTCSATYQAASSTGYLLKNAADSSSATTLGNLLGLTNTNAGAAGVLSLTNSGTNSALSVTQSGNPSAGQALILANNTNGTPSGNLIDLQVGGASKFSVNSAGNLTTSGTMTSGTVNGQTISSSASFTGTVTTASTLTVSAGGLTVTAGGASITGNSSVTGTLNVSSITTINSNLIQAFSAAASASAHSITATNTNVSATPDQVNGVSINMIGTANTNATNTNNGLNFSGITAQTGNIFNAISVANTSYNSILTVGATQIINGSGVVQGAGISGIYSNLTGSGALASGSIASGFGTIATAQNITTTTAIQGGTFANTGSSFAVNSTGNVTTALSGTTGATLVCQNTTSQLAGCTNTYAQTSDTTDFIRNQSSLQASSNFNISGTGTAATSLLTVLVDTPAVGTLGVGTGTATGLTLGKSSYQVSLPGGLTTNGSAIATANGNLTLGSGTITTTGTITSGLINGQTISSAASFTGTLATVGAINGQTITSAASFTGTVTIATSAIVPLVQTADSAAGNTTTITLRSGNVTGGSGLSTGNVTIQSGDGTGTSSSSGNVSIDAGAKSAGGFAGNLNIGTTNAPNITIGRNGTTPTAVSIQGAAATSGLVMSNAAGTFSSTIAFANPTATTTTTFSNAGGTVCTTISSTCSTTYQAAGTYLAKNAADTSSAGVAGYLLGLTNTSGNVLQLTGSGTGSALSIAQSGNPVAGSAVIFANNTNGTPSGNLIDLQAASVSKFSVTSAGAVTAASTINSQTISATAQFTGTITSANTVTVQAGGIAVTGNSSVTGTLGVSSNVTVSAGNLTLSNGTLSVTSAAQNSITGSLKLTGGLDNQNGGITNTGAVAGATTVTASGTIIGGGAFKSADAGSSSAVSLTSGNASAGTSGNVTVDAGTASSTTGVVNIGTSNASAINVGNSTAAVTMQGSATSKLVFGNSTISAASSATVATYQFAAPSSATTYNICTSDPSSCTATFLRKNIVNEQSSAGLTSGQYLYQFANTGAATADVLQLNSGTGTGSGLKVTAAANAAAGNALIYAKLTNAAVGGNLLDLWSGASGSETSKFAVAASGAVSSGTINGQTLGATSQLAIVNTSGLLTANTLTVTSAANFNGAATVTGLLTANGGASVTGGIANNAGGITGAGAVSGITSLQFNTAGTIDTNAAVALTIGGTNASTITIGKNTATQPTISLQGGNGSTFTDTNGANATTLAFLAPGAASKTVSIPNETGTICTNAASSNATCSNFAPATLGTGYIQNQIAAQQSLSNFWISATGRADTSILTPLLDATTAGGSVAIGTTNATAGVNINQNTTLASGKSLTLQGALTQSGGTISLAGNGSSTIQTTANALTIISATAATWSTGAGVLTVQGFGGTTINSPNAAGALTGSLTVQSGNVTSGAFASGSIGIDVGSSSGTTGTINLGVTSASAISIGHTTVITNISGTTQIGTLNTAGTGALVNNGSTVNSVYVMANLATGGWDAGGAAATVDKYTYISATQTTASQTLTIPTPTASTTYGRLLYLTNVGTASFTLLTTTIGAGSTATLVWANTNGAASWTFAGADGSGILNQNTADQTAGFRITGIAQVENKLITPIVDSIAGTLSIGTATANAIILGGAPTTGTISLLTNGASAGVVVKDSVNSTTELVVQNSNSESILLADSTTTNLLKNSGFEPATTTNWAGKGATLPTVSADTTASNVFQGASSLKAVTTVATSGLTTTGNASAAFTSAITATTQYQMTFMAKCSASIGTLTIGRQDVAGTDVNVVTTGACTTGWQQFTAHWTTGGTITNPQIYVTLGTTTSGTLWIDAVSFIQTNTSAATNYDIGSVQVGGVLTNPAVFQNNADSTLAFQIQNAAGTSLFNVDTLNAAVRIGDTTNNVSFTAGTREPVLNGTARHAKSIRLTAEYAGAVLDTGGQASLSGTMTAGFDATQRFGYYKWTTNLASAQTYDIVVTIPLPDDWAAWNGNPTIKDYASSIAAGNTINVINMTRTDGTADTTFAATPVNITPGGTSTWTSYSTKGLDTTGYSAGGSMTIRIRMSSISSSDIRLGDIILPYFSKY
jgi:hypothetical protein